MERDLSIYHSFCATLCVINALVISSEPLSQGSPENTMFSSNDDGSLQSWYEVNILPKLAKAKEHVSKIFPLCFRLETVENLFSLIFLNSSLKIEESVLSSGEEGAADPKVGILTPQMSGSYIESVASSVTESPVINAESPKFMEIKSAEILVDSKTEPKFQGEESPDSKMERKQTDNEFADSKPESKGGKMSEVIASVLETTTPRRGSDTGALRRGSESGTYTYLSTNSTGSNPNSSKVGFLAADYLVRDILTVVKQSLSDLNTTRAALQSNGANVDLNLPPGTVDLEKELRKLVWSITEEEVSGRASRLGQYISEAQWRLQLVCSVPLQYGQMAQANQMLDDSTDDEGYEAELGKPIRVVSVV